MAKVVRMLMGALACLLIVSITAEAQVQPMPVAEIWEFASWGTLRPVDSKGFVWKFYPELRETRKREVKITVPSSLVYLEVEGRIFPPSYRVTLVHRDEVTLKFVRPQKLVAPQAQSPPLPAPKTLEEFLAFGRAERIAGMVKGFVFYPHKPGFKFHVTSQLEKVDTQSGECRPGNPCVIGDVGTLWFKRKQ
jgi:hypothetical protein